MILNTLQHLYQQFLFLNGLLRHLNVLKFYLVELIFSGSHFRVSRRLKIKCVVFGFIFWADWLLAWIHGFIHPKKRKVWVAIEHKGKRKPKNK